MSDDNELARIAAKSPACRAERKPTDMTDDEAANVAREFERLQAERVAAVARAETAEARLNWLIATIVVPLAASFDEGPDGAEVLRSAAYRYAREWWAENRYHRFGVAAAAAPERETP